MSKLETLEYQVPQQTRDESGRLLAPDGWPIGGMARVKEAAVASSMPGSTIYRMIDAGLLPVTRHGRTVLIKWSDVRRYLFDGA